MQRICVASSTKFKKCTFLVYIIFLQLCACLNYYSKNTSKNIVQWHIKSHKHNKVCNKHTISPKSNVLVCLFGLQYVHKIVDYQESDWVFGYLPI